MWGIVWLCHMVSLSLYRQCGRDVGLREQHPLEYRLPRAWSVRTLLDALVVESSTTPLYIIKGLINNYVSSHLIV